MRHLLVSALALVLLCDLASAQNRVRTQTILPQPPPDTQTAAPPGEPTPAAPAPTTPATPPPAKTQAATPPAATTPPRPAPEIITDLARLPAPVAKMRARILEAARTGDPEKLAAVMQASETMPMFTFGADKSPLIYWRANYPDSGGVEVLAILINILESGYVRIDQGTPQETYVWPYFAFTALDTLNAEQKVALFRIVTGADYKEMSESGAYTFYRLGIAPDGTWRFFVSG